MSRFSLIGLLTAALTVAVPTPWGPRRAWNRNIASGDVKPVRKWRREWPGALSATQRRARQCRKG